MCENAFIASVLAKAPPHNHKVAVRVHRHRRHGLIVAASRIDLELTTKWTPGRIKPSSNYLQVNDRITAGVAGIGDLHLARPGDHEATSGVHRSQGALKLLLAGADVLMMASILLMKGPGVLTTMLDEMRAWLEENEYDSVEQMKGSMSRANCPDPEALDRANYMRALRTFTAPSATPAGAED